MFLKSQFPSLQRAVNSKINFVVSGGVKDDEDVYEVNKRDYYACIVGKAYYEGRINLKEVIENAG